MDEWKQEGQYGWTHPSGWNIGRYVVSGTAVFRLWHGDETQGRFEHLEAAKTRHTELLAGTPISCFAGRMRAPPSGQSKGRDFSADARPGVTPRNAKWRTTRQAREVLAEPQQPHDI
jgi:hypothetical protein